MRGRRRGTGSLAAAFLAALAIGSSPAPAQGGPSIDGDLSDWCAGAYSNTGAGGGRQEDRAVRLDCGVCSATDTLTCVSDGDCPGEETCTAPSSRSELVWWDARADAAVNDLATVTLTHDDTNLYFGLEFWFYPDPVSLPLVQIAIDFTPGGLTNWHDPHGALTDPGHCSVAIDRGCTIDADCHFCAISTEAPFSSRPQVCGSGCNPDIPMDVCDTSETCIGAGSLGPTPGAGADAVPATAADYLVVYDSGRFLVGVEDAVQLMKPSGGAWVAIAAFPVQTNPGASGDDPDPQAVLEFAIPWSGFGCTGCPAACTCPDFGPGQPFRFLATVARAFFTLDYAPDAAIEDVQSEAVALWTTTTPDGCPGPGTSTLACELADGSQDAFVPGAPGGRVDGLRLSKATAGSIRLDWNRSCSAADTAYGLYRGELGDYDGHRPMPGGCDHASTTATITADPGDHYYLVVPADGTVEGSYGDDSTGTARSASAAACHVQEPAGCAAP